MPKVSKRVSQVIHSEIGSSCNKMHLGESGQGNARQIGEVAQAIRRGNAASVAGIVVIDATY
jgi:hypothetical protein